MIRGSASGEHSGTPSRHLDNPFAHTYALRQVANVKGVHMEAVRLSRRQLLATSVVAIPTLATVSASDSTSPVLDPENRFVAVVRGVDADLLDVEIKGRTHQLLRNDASVISRGDDGPLKDFSQFQVGDQIVVELQRVELGLLAVMVASPFAVARGRVLGFDSERLTLRTPAGEFNTTHLTSTSAATLGPESVEPGVSFEALVWDDLGRRNVLLMVATGE